MKSVVVGCLVAGAVVLLVAMGGVWYLAIREGLQLSSQVQAPGQAVVDQPLELVITMSNPHAETVTLDSIDVDLDLLAGFQVVSVDPDPSDTMEIPFVSQRSWSFGSAVDAGAELEVTFTLRPIEAGHFTGTLDVCNPEQDCTGHFVDLVVQEAPAP